MTKKIKKNNSNENKAMLTTVTSALLAALVLFKTFENVQNLKQDMQGAPNSYALWPALVLSLYAFSKTRNIRIKYAVVAIVTVLAVSILVWFFGVTEATNFLYNYG